jgi:hypothetical protein
MSARNMLMKKYYEVGEVVRARVSRLVSMPHPLPMRELPPLEVIAERRAQGRGIGEREHRPFWVCD